MGSNSKRPTDWDKLNYINLKEDAIRLGLQWDKYGELKWQVAKVLKEWERSQPSNIRRLAQVAEVAPPSSSMLPCTLLAIPVAVLGYFLCRRVRCQRKPELVLPAP